VLAAAPPPADGFAHDAFISFSKDKLDKTWARKAFLPALKAAGLNVVSEDDFALGAPLINEMERAVVQSRYTIGLLTPRSLADNFADLNSVLARHLGLEKSQRRFIGVMRERCTPRLSVRALYYLDMTDDDEFDINIARLVSQLRQAPEIRRTDD
jgi:TIR domain